MKKKKHGGKRQGSGRKEATDKKQQVCLYVYSSVIGSYGGKEKLQEMLYEFIKEKINN